MKKLILFALICLCCCVMQSCSSPESKAKKRLPEYMKSIAKDPESVIISDEEVKISNDSLVIIEFTCRAKNGFGGYNITPYEYVMVRMPDKEKGKVWREHAKNIKNGESIIKISNDSFNKYSTDDRDVTRVEELTYICAITCSLFAGREIKD